MTTARLCDVPQVPWLDSLGHIAVSWSCSSVDPNNGCICNYTLIIISISFYNAAQWGNWDRDHELSTQISLVPRPPPFLPSVCIHNNTRERKTSGRPVSSIFRFHVLLWTQTGDKNGGGLGPRLHPDGWAVNEQLSLNQLLACVAPQLLDMKWVVIVAINGWIVHIDMSSYLSINLLHHRH